MAQVSTRVAAALAVLSLTVPALAACSDDPPSASPPPTSSSSPTASATPSGPPTMPAAAKGRTPEAAEAFVRYYVDLINYVIRTLDTDQMEKVSARGCSACTAIVKAAANMRVNDRSYEGGAWSITGIEAASAPRGRRAMQATIEIDRLVVVSKEGRKVVKAHTTGLAFEVSRADDSWQVERLIGVSG